MTVFGSDLRVHRPVAIFLATLLQWKLEHVARGMFFFFFVPMRRRIGIYITGVPFADSNRPSFNLVYRPARSKAVLPILMDD